MTPTSVDSTAGRRRPKSWVVLTVSVTTWAALIAFVVLTLGPPLLGWNMLLATDLLHIVAPWSSFLGPYDPVTNGMSSDTVDSGTPQVWAIVEAARQGVFAAWNPWVGGGTELAGLPNSGLYSPLSVGWWFLPLSYAPGFTKLLEIAIVTFGMSLFLRRLRMPNAAWALASLLFVSSGFMISWTNWPQTRVAAFIPLLFWAIELAVVRHRVRDLMPLALVVAAMLLGGFPAVVGYALYAGGAYALVRAIAVHRAVRPVVKALLVSVGGVVGGVALAAVMLVPFALNAASVLDFDVRAQTPDGTLNLGDLVSAIVPDVIGEVSVANGYGAGSPVERFSYLGVIAILLVVANFALPRVGGIGAPRRGTLFHLVALAVSIVLVYVGGPVLAAFQELPVFSNNPTPRLRSMIGFFVAVLAAAGFAMLIGERTRRAPETVDMLTERRPWTRGTAVLSALSTIVFALLVVGFVWSYERTILRVPDEALAELAEHTTFILWSAIGGSVLIVGARFIRVGAVRAVALSLLPVLIVIPAIGVANTWWPKASLDTAYPVTPAIDYLQRHQGQERFASVGTTMMPGSSSLYQLRSLGGHGFQTSQWKDLLTAVDPAVFASTTYSTLTFEGLTTSIRSPILDRLGVAYVVQAPNLPPPGILEGEARGGGIAIDADTSVHSGIRQGPVRNVGFAVYDRILDIPAGTTLTVRLEEVDTGAVLAETTTWYATLGNERNVVVHGEDIPAETRWRAVVSISDGVGGLFASASDSSQVALSVIRPQDDGLRIAHTGDATIIERTTALQRVRWADEAIVEVDPKRRVELLADPELDPDVVVLERDADVEDATDAISGDDAAPRREGARLQVASQHEDPNLVAARVTADEPGWLVVEDSLRRPGWAATVDGAPAEIIDAEHAGGAVRVPAGEHTVELRYTTPGFALGTAVSIATAGAMLVWNAVIAVLWRRRRRLDSARDASSEATAAG